MIPRNDTLNQLFQTPAPTHARAMPRSDSPGILAFVGYAYGPTLRPEACPVFQCSDCLLLMYDEPASQLDQMHRRPPRQPRRIVATARLERIT